MSAYEAAIVGGGPAGLSAALTLARAHRRAIVLDAGTPRNAASPGVYGLPSRDGITPARLKCLARAEIENYGSIEFLDRAAEEISPLGHGSGFRVGVDGFPAIVATHVVIATGVVDVLPDIDGFRDRWGRDVIHCEFCHGWENTVGRWGVLVKNAAELESVGRLMNWTSEIVAFIQPEAEVPTGIVQSFERRGVVVERDPVRAIDLDSKGHLAGVRLVDGRRVPCRTLLHQPSQQPAAIVRAAGVGLDGDGRVVVDQNFETSVPGLFAGGDLVPGPQTVLTALAAGAAIGRRLAFLLAMRRGLRPDARQRAVSV